MTRRQAIAGIGATVATVALSPASAAAGALGSSSGLGGPAKHMMVPDHEQAFSCSGSMR